jgi:hypothetical protein
MIKNNTGINELLKGATSQEELMGLRRISSLQYQASAKTLRKRARIVARKETELTKL